MNEEWHHIEAEGKVLGRLATEVSSLLLGKHRVDAARHTVSPVYVVVTGTDKVALTGNKEAQKKYYRHTGYPGGLKTRTAAQVRQSDSRRLVEHAVLGMLPKNKLRTERMRHLKLYAGDEHPHLAQLN